MSLLAAVTGWWDWRKSSEPGNQARRTINTHAVIMITVTVSVLALADIAWRLNDYHTQAATPIALVVLSLVALVSLGATYGGTLVFDYGFNVETAGDHPVWHPSEQDVLPGQH